MGKTTRVEGVHENSNYLQEIMRKQKEFKTKASTIYACLSVVLMISLVSRVDEGVR